MRAALAAVLLVSATAIATPVSSASSPEPTLAPLNENGDHIDDAYIIVFKQGTTTNQMALHLSGVEAWHGLDVSADDLVSPTASPHPPLPCSASPK